MWWIFRAEDVPDAHPNDYGKARGRRDVLVRYMAHRYLAELQRGRAIPERFRIAFAIFPRDDT